MPNKSKSNGHDPRDHIVGLEKGLRVIECFDELHQKLTIAEVAQTVGLSRAAARRCLLTLTHLGYADYDGKFFRLVARSMRLGYAYLSSSSTPYILQTYLERLAEQIHESCSAAILDETEIVYIARAAVKRLISMNVSIGTRLPSYCTSLGRVLLANLDPAEAKKRLLRSKREKRTRNTLTDVSKLTKLLAKVHNNGCCLVKEEMEVGLISLAIPIYNSAGSVVAAMSVSTQPQRLSAERVMKLYLPKLLETQNTVRLLLR